jgi:hypothetical protein
MEKLLEIGPGPTRSLMSMTDAEWYHSQSEL